MQRKKTCSIIKGRKVSLVFIHRPWLVSRLVQETQLAVNHDAVCLQQTATLKCSVGFIIMLCETISRLLFIIAIR